MNSLTISREGATLLTEEWLPVAGYEDRYEVSSKGRCRRMAYVSFAGTSMPIRVLTPYPNEDGYLRYSLFKDISADRKTRHRFNAFLHRLVATAFISNPDDLPEINHKDGNILNNEIYNLEWVTHTENVRHAYRTGLNPPRDGDLNPFYQGPIVAIDSSGAVVATMRGGKEIRAHGYTGPGVYSCLSGKQKTHRNLAFRRL